MRKTVYISIFLLFSISSFSQETEYKYRLFTYGSINYHHSKAMKFVADNWNIELYGVAGSSVEHRVKDSVDIKNVELWKKLDQTKSTDSKKEFRKQVIAEMINIQTGQKIVDSSRKIKNAITQLKNSESDSYAELEFKKENGVYVWVIYSTEKEKYFGTSVAEFNVIVDLNTKLVEIEPIKKN